MLTTEELLKEIREVARSVYENERLAVLAEREACAKLIEQRGQRYVSKWMNYDDMETQSKAYAWEAEQHAAAIRSRTQEKP